MDRSSGSWSEKQEAGSSRKSLEQYHRENRSYSLDNPVLQRGDDILRQKSDLGRLTLEKARQAPKHPDTLELFNNRYEYKINEIPVDSSNYKIETKVKNTGNTQYENIINTKDGIVTLKYNYKTHDINHGGNGALYLNHIIYNQLLLVMNECNRPIESFNLKEIRIENVLNVKSMQTLKRAFHNSDSSLQR